VPQPPADLVTGHRVAHGLGHDKAGARRGGLRRLIDKKVDDHRAAPGPAPTANRCGEVSAAPQSLRRGQHDYLDIRPDQRRLRPTACRGPWRGGWRGWRGRHGYACAAGNRGSSRDGGCSAGKCACSRQNSVFVGHPRDRRRPGGIKAARRHFSRARRSNRPTLRSTPGVVNHRRVGTPTDHFPVRGFVTHAGPSAHGVNLFVPGLPRGGYRRLMRVPPRC